MSELQQNLQVQNWESLELSVAEEGGGGIWEEELGKFVITGLLEQLA